MRVNTTPMRLLLTAACLSLSLVGCNQAARSNSAPANNQSAQTSDRASIAQLSTPPSDNPPQATTVAQVPAPQISNLPFVGKRFFNFLGGSGTGYSITIEVSGNTVIQQHGTMNSSTVYQGPFQETMEGITIKDGYASTCDRQESTSEGEPVPCKTKLYE